MFLFHALTQTAQKDYFDSGMGYPELAGPSLHSSCLKCLLLFFSIGVWCSEILLILSVS